MPGRTATILASGQPARSVRSVNHAAALITRILFRAAIVIAYLIIFAPIVMVLAISFFAQEIVTFPPESLTFAWYVNAWGQRDFARGFLTSLEVALAASAIGVPL